MASSYPVWLSMDSEPRGSSGVRCDPFLFHAQSDPNASLASGEARSDNLVPGEE